MKNFIKIQYQLYLLGKNSIDLERIKQLASLYLSISEYNEMFEENSIQE